MTETKLWFNAGASVGDAGPALNHSLATASSEM